jgi:hypothetical protein
MSPAPVRDNREFSGLTAAQDRGPGSPAAPAPQHASFITFVSLRPLPTTPGAAQLKDLGS